MQNLTIGALAKAAGVGVETVRYYQRRGLLEAPRRPAGSVRRYGEDTVGRLRFIRRAQALGFTLGEIGELLRLERTPDCGRAQRLASEKLASVEAKLADLGRMRRRLRALVAACAAGRDPRSCPIVVSLAERELP
jgi:MerR family mercuric resistance operon transcriptional regulator